MAGATTRGMVWAFGARLDKGSHALQSEGGNPTNKKRGTVRSEGPLGGVDKRCVEDRTGVREEEEGSEREGKEVEKQNGVRGTGTDIESGSPTVATIFFSFSAC